MVPMADRNEYQKHASRKQYREHTYTDGNTVRRQQTVPVPRRSEEVPQRSREEIIRERERQRAARRNRQRALAVNRGYVVFLTAATLLCCAVCAVFIYFQSNITTRISSIASLESQISELKGDNDAMEKRLETSMTLDEIKTRAGELGLIYPGSDQIQRYSVESSDYMNQCADVASR